MKTLVTAIGGRLMLEFCIFLGCLRWTLTQGTRQQFTQWPWVEHSNF